eukprot:SAG11_NODE_16659_length_541_cov_0.837104_1_plen_41_part_01
MPDVLWHQVPQALQELLENMPTLHHEVATDSRSFHFDSEAC